jgi:hypothetical protein
MLELPPEEYGPRYAKILAGLNPRATWDQLHALAGGAEPVLLCFERPPFRYPDNLCHRRRVADWFEKELGEIVPEYDPAEGDGHPKLI